MNPIPRLVANKILASPNHGYASFITDPRQLVKIHCHAYYELFIVCQGYGTHIVNHTSTPLSPGVLYFMRPDDIHCYTNTTANFKIINILVPNEIFETLCDYLGEDFYQELLKNSLPPHAEVTMKEFKSIVTELEQLVLSKKIMKDKSDLFFRITLFNLMTKYFLPALQKASGNTPDWLRWLSLEMLKKENFTEGLPALYRLSGKSIEHLSRSCKKYLKKSPTKLINDIRLEFSVNELLNTDKKALQICEEAGFDSLSHYYHVFKESYQISPAAFRKAYQNEKHTIVPQNFMENAAIPNALPFDMGINTSPTFR